MSDPSGAAVSVLIHRRKYAIVPFIVWASIVLNHDLANWLSRHIFSSARHKLW